MRSAISIVILLLLASTAAAICLKPEDGMTATNSVLICPGAYELPHGITLSGDRIEIDCKGSELKGASAETGIKLIGKELVVLNCRISNYDTGVDVKGSARFVAITINNSRLGVQSTTPIIDNIEYENVQEKVRILEQVPLPTARTVELHAAPTPSLIPELGLEAEYFTVAPIIDVKKQASINDDRTIVSIEITALEDVKELQVRERIPKSLARNVDEILFSIQPRIINPDPDVVFSIGNLSIKSKFIIKYTLEKKAEEYDLQQTQTIPYSEKKQQLPEKEIPVPEKPAPIIQWPQPKAGEIAEGVFVPYWLVGALFFLTLFLLWLKRHHR